MSCACTSAGKVANAPGNMPQSMPQAPCSAQAPRRRPSPGSRRAAPGTRALYSDLGFILLDWILERALGAPGERLFRERVAGPAGLGGFIEFAGGLSAER